MLLLAATLQYFPYMFKLQVIKNKTLNLFNQKIVYLYQCCLLLKSFLVM